MKPILVVDDEPQIRSYLKKLLLREGFEILAVHNGASAIGMIREIGGNIAALVTDIEMRDMDGIVLAKTVTGEFPDISILFITALPISEIDLRLSVPRCVLLQKPFDSKDFVQSLRNLLMRPEEASSSIAH